MLPAVWLKSPVTISTNTYISSTVYDFVPSAAVVSLVLLITRFAGVCCPSNFAELSSSENVASVKDISIVSPLSMLILFIAFSVIVPIGKTIRAFMSLVLAHDPAMYFFHTAPVSVLDVSSHKSPVLGLGGAVALLVKVTASPSSVQAVNFIGVSVVAVASIDLYSFSYS